LASLYINEPLQTYIDSTIIDGNYIGSCIIIENGETAEVNGFTLVNNEEGLNIPLDDYPQQCRRWNLHRSRQFCESFELYN